MIPIRVRKSDGQMQIYFGIGRTRTRGIHE